MAVVDGPSDPSAEADMNVYRKEFGLPECTEANKCFKQLNSNGEVSHPTTTSGTTWHDEIALDLDMVSAACQECHIDLVEGTVSGNAGLLAAEEEATKLNVTAISNSWNLGFEVNNPANSAVNCEISACITAEQEETDDKIFQHPGGAGSSTPAATTATPCATRPPRRTWSPSEARP